MNTNNNKLKTQKLIDAGDIQLSVYEWGKSSIRKETVVLIHGYPDDASVWDKMAEILAETFHVVSYDVRGTGLSTAPISSKGYKFEYLLSDLNYVLDHVSPKRKVHLVGHDWGALQGWEAVFDPHLQQKIQSYTTLAPSLDHVGGWFQQHFFSFKPKQQWKAVKQLLSSSYMGFFSLPILPELSWKTALIHTWPKIISRLENIQVDIQPNLLRNGISGLELYRANLIASLLFPKSRTTNVPVHLLSMTGDPFVPQHMLENLNRDVDAQFERTDIDAGHWGILSKAELIVDSISKFILDLKVSKVN